MCSTASGSLVRLDNLSPTTQYTTRVQLSRHGAGEEPASLDPKPRSPHRCSVRAQTQPHVHHTGDDLTPVFVSELPVGVKLSPVSPTALLLSWDAAPAENDWSYEVTCQQVGASGTEMRFQLASNSSGLGLNELKPRHNTSAR